MRFFPYILFCIIIIVLFPFFVGGIGFDYNSILNDNDFSDSILRSLLLGIVSSVLVAIFSFIGAVLLENISIFSKTGKNLSFLILPFCLGNTTIAFIFKLALDGTYIFDKVVSQGGFAVFCILLLIQVWQYLFLFTYIIWINNQSIANTKIAYCNANKLGFFSKLKDVYLPNSKNLLILTSLMVFIFSFYEGAKSQFIFKASAGTKTEMVSNYLERSYKSMSLISPQVATNQLYAKGLFLFCLIIVLLLIYFIIINWSNNRIIRLKFFHSLTKPHIIRSGRFFAGLFIVLIILPLVAAFLKFDFAISKESMEILIPFVYTLLAAFITTLVAILFSISIRLLWNKTMEGFNKKSILCFIGLFLLNIIPPLCILITGFYWMKVISYNSALTIVASWVIGHVILTLPLLTAFLLVTHFRFKNNELFFMKVHKVNSSTIVKNSFFQRFKVDYLLVFVFAFAFIWSEDVLNNIFSDNIKTFASSMKMYIYGRSTDNAKAFVFLLISLMLASLCIVFWRKIISKIMTNKTEIND